MTSRLLALALLLCALALSACGPTAEEQAAADRMEKGIQASRDAMNAPRAGAPSTGTPAPTNR